MTAGIQRAREQLEALAAQPAAGAQFAEPVMAAVVAAIGFDGFCLLGFDPASGIRSFMFCRHGVGDPKQLARNEWDQRDLHRYSDLARARVPVGVLSDDDRDTSWSPRLQEILRPAGVSSELRVALRDGGRLWGALVLFRADPRRPFSTTEVEAALEISGPLAQAVRRYSVRRQPPAALAPDPGVVVVGADDEITSMTTSAGAWLAEAVAGGLDEDQAGRVHRAVYEVARAARLGATTPITRIRTTSGHWLAVTGAALDESDRVAIVLQAATVQQVLPAAALWYRLTRRESDVLATVAAGMSGKVAARRLGLSAYTVEDHLTSVYRKTGVTGKDELIADLAGLTA